MWQRMAHTTNQMLSKKPFRVHMIAVLLPTKDRLVAQYQNRAFALAPPLVPMNIERDGGRRVLGHVAVHKAVFLPQAFEQGLCFGHGVQLKTTEEVEAMEGFCETST